MSLLRVGVRSNGTRGSGRFGPRLVFGKDGKLVGQGALECGPRLASCDQSSEIGEFGDDVRVAKLPENGDDHQIADREAAECVVICAQLEAELVALPPEERLDYLKSLKVSTSGVDQLIKSAYHLLGLMSFLTAGEKEVRAWTIPQGTRAQTAAGTIHSDIERGFIRAEVVSYEELMAAGSYATARDKGLLRLEGKDYIMREGDVVHFRFNV